MAGLYNRPGQGRPKKLNEEEEIDILMRVYEEPRTLKKILADVSKEINKKISLSTIKRIIKLFGLCWKRVKKSLRSKRNENDFQKAKIEIIDLIHRAQSGEIDLYYYDESSFSLNSYIPYAWQPKCYNIEVSTQRSQGLNVLGFMPYDGKNVISFVFEQSINSSVVIECFDYFSKSLSKETILILDNAPTHKSKKFEEKIQEWESKGLHLKFLPPYSPELNKIEILWRFIKYRWIDLTEIMHLKCTDL